MKLYKITKTSIWLLITLLAILIAYVLLYYTLGIQEFQRKAVSIEKEVIYHQNMNNQIVRINEIRDSIYLPGVNKNYMKLLYESRTVEFIQALPLAEAGTAMDNFYRNLITINLKIDELSSENEKLRPDIQQMQKNIIKSYRQKNKYRTNQLQYKKKN